MVTTLQCLDTDEVTVLLDCNVATTPGFQLLGNVDLGSINTEYDWLVQAPYPGAVQAQHHQPIATMQFRLFANYGSFDNLLTDIRTLGKLLDQGHVWKWQPEGSASPLYIDAVPSPISALFRGQDIALYKLVKLFQDPDGYPVTILRQPTLRGVKLTNRFNGQVTNAATSRKCLVNNPGNMPSLGIVRVQPNTGYTNLVQWRCGRRSRGNLAEYAANYVSFEMEGCVLSNGTASAAVTGSSGGNCAQTTFSTANSMLLRARKVITPVTKAALEGTYRILMTWEPTTISAFKVTVQLRWGTSDPVPAPVAAFSNAPITLDFTGRSGTAMFEEADLGMVTFPVEGNVLVLELWASCDTSSILANWDTMTLMPADEQLVTVSVPNLRVPLIGGDNWPSVVNAVGVHVDPDGCKTGSALVTGTNYMQTNLRWRGLTYTPTGGITLVPGKHIFNLTGSTYSSYGAILGYLRVRRGAGVGVTLNAWVAATAYTVGTIVTPKPAGQGLKGRTWRCSTAGTSHATTEPVWTDVDGAVITDNTAVWTETTVASTPVVGVGTAQSVFATWTVSFDAASGINYEAVVVQTATSLADGFSYSRAIRDVSFSHTFIPVVSNPFRMALDSQKQIAYTDDGFGGAVGSLQADGIVQLAPGDQEFVWSFSSVPSVGMDTEDPRGPITACDPLYQSIVTFDVIPFYGPE